MNAKHQSSRHKFSVPDPCLSTIKKKRETVVDLRIGCRFTTDLKLSLRLS